MAHRWGVALLVGAAALLFTPVAVELARTPNWLDHPSWNGGAYLLGWHGMVRAELDATGTAAVLATLDSYRGGSATEAQMVALLGERDFDYRLGSFAHAASDWGFPGRWALAEVGALPGLPTPFLAHLTDAGGRFVIVHRVASGQVYLADPNAGRLLMPLASFARLSSQQVYLFDHPSVIPGVW
jgi:ABC-type bacteriocin/lantibiotic exporter with double-glycine peptidase domain